MKIKYGSIVTDGAGKLGGHVYSKNASGSYVRTKVTPTNAQTDAQTEVRARFAALSQAWRSLSDSTRAAWIAAVSSFTSTDVFGDTVTPTGLQLYQKLNNNLETVGEAAIDDAPVVGSVEALSSLSATATEAGVVTITYSPAIPATQKSKIFATAPMSPGISNANSDYRLIGTLATANASPFAISSMYISKFGSLTGKAGQKVFIKIEPVLLAQGQPGVALSTNCIITA